MFFLIGTWPGKKVLGVINGYTVYMVYESLMLFFIPIFKFGKRYFAQKDSTVYEIDKETGQSIERGEEVSLDFSRASTISRSANYYNPAYNGFPGSMQRTDIGSGDAAGGGMACAGTTGGGMIVGKICMRCGFKTDIQEYTHCPMCGNLLVHDDGEG